MVPTTKILEITFPVLVIPVAVDLYVTTIYQPCNDHLQTTPLKIMRNKSSDQRDTINYSRESLQRLYEVL